LAKDKNNNKENGLILLLFINRIHHWLPKVIIQLIFQLIIGSIIVQLIIHSDFQIIQSKVSINLLSFSLLTKVQSQLKLKNFLDYSYKLNQITISIKKKKEIISF